MYEAHDLILRVVELQKSSTSQFCACVYPEVTLIRRTWEPCEGNWIHALKNLEFSDSLNTMGPWGVAQCFLKILVFHPHTKLWQKLRASIPTSI